MAKPITQLISAYRRVGQAILHEMGSSLHITRQVEMFGWRAHRNHDELIATDAPDGVAAPEALLQLGGYATEKLIPCLVAIGIVDEFETDHVQMQHRDTLAATADVPALERFTRSLSLVFAKVPAPEGAPPEQYTMDHSATMAVLDPQGRMAGVIQPPLDPGAIAADLLALTQASAP